MKAKYTLPLVTALMGLWSCDLVQPGDVVNPNVDEETFLQSDNAMTTWTNGTRMKFATALGDWCQLMEILSDNYFNNFTRSSKTFDTPLLLHTDADITAMQRSVGTMREMADYGIRTVAGRDKPSTDELFTLYTIKAYAFLLGGEAFVGLPLETGGDIHPYREHLDQALATLDEALTYATTDDEKAFVATLQARAYYGLGDREKAVKAARQALGLAPDFYRQATFDGENGVNNGIQEAVWSNWFQPLPRLDFLDPKYFQTTSNEQRPITIAKAEENLLILAEAHLAERDLEAAKADLRTLLQLVGSRPVQERLNDQLEKRDNGVYKAYPKQADYQVRASADDPLRAGLIIDRQAPALITVPYISGTSVTLPMVEALADYDAALELVYLLRQEIFFGEGRRVADLGIRLPVCEVEAASARNADGYIKAVIPPFIPLKQGMDDFSIDEATRTVTIAYNMNRIIVQNKSTEYVVPFE